MRLTDLSPSSQEFIYNLQFAQSGKKPENVFAIAIALSTTPPTLTYVDYKNEEGEYRAQIIARSYKEHNLIRDAEILESLLQFVAFDFHAVLDLAPKLYALRYLQAYDHRYFLNTFDEVSERNYFYTTIPDAYRKVATENSSKILTMTEGMHNFIKDYETGKASNG